MSIGRIVARRDPPKVSRGIITINHSKDSDYNKQRDNDILPLEVCGPTSMTMALLQAGHFIVSLTEKDPADTLTKHLMTPEAFEQMYKAIGTKNTKWKPFNIHAVLTWGVNNFIGEVVSQFRTDWRLRDILFNIVQGGGAVLAGDFTLPDGRELGHMVSLAGFETYQHNIENLIDSSEIDLKAVTSFIIDDPYGNWYTGYKDHHGNNIEYSVKDFNSIFRVKDNSGAKWAHLIKPKKYTESKGFTITI